jgi:hypothetical protein
MLVLDCPIPKADWAHEVNERDGVSIPPTEHPTETTVEDAGSWEPAVQSIVEYQHLGDNWDGFGAKAPSRELLASAVGLAYLLHEKRMVPPDRVAPGVAGSVILEWQFPDGTYADVEIVEPLYAEVMVIEPGDPAKHWALPTE